MKKDVIIREYKILNDEITEFEQSIISGERKIETINDWTNLKNRAYILKRKCTELLGVILGVSITSNMENKPILFSTIEYIYECIYQVEQNYMGKTLIDDIDIIMSNIKVLCANNRIINTLKQMEQQSKSNLKNGVKSVNMIDFYKNTYIIASAFASDFVKNTMLQERLYEDCNQANEFVFGKSLKR